MYLHAFFGRSVFDERLWTPSVRLMLEYMVKERTLLGIPV